MDVTDQLNLSRQMMGGSGSSNPAYYSSSKTLNYALTSNSMLNARAERVTAIPQNVNYQDTIGLFGAENVYIKIDLDIQSINRIAEQDQTPVNTYYPAFIDESRDDSDGIYIDASTNYNLDILPNNDYFPAEISYDLEPTPRSLVSVDLNNLKTGNKYIDAWFDVRLYTKDRKEFPYDKMYVPSNDYFYVGFHARNTKRLPYNVRMTVGSEILSEFDLTDDQRRYLASSQ